MNSYYYWHHDSDGIWLLSETPSWSPIDHRCKGDLMFRMGIVALITGDVNVIKALIALLNDCKRWTDSLNQSTDSRNILDYWWSRLLFKLKIGPLKYRPQKSVTRDPYIMAYCAIYWWQYEMIQNLKVPWWIWTPSFYHWVQFLKTRKPIHKDKYELWTKLSIDVSVAFGFPGYVKSLLAWRAFIVQSDEIKKYLIRYIPHWNLLNRLLCGDKSIMESEVNNYIGSEGYFWNREELPDTLNELGENEPIYLDKDILEFAYNNRNH